MGPDPFALLPRFILILGHAPARSFERIDIVAKLSRRSWDPAGLRETGSLHRLGSAATDEEVGRHQAFALDLDFTALLEDELVAEHLDH